jgi:hypothetical protein
MSSWFTEGTAHRTRVQPTPIIHILVDQGGDWAMWCSGSKGREDSPHGNRTCRECRTLMREAFERGEVTAYEARNWLTPEQIAASAADTDA